MKNKNFFSINRLVKSSLLLTILFYLTLFVTTKAFSESPLTKELSVFSVMTIETTDSLVVKKIDIIVEKTKHISMIDEGLLKFFAENLNFTEEEKQKDGKLIVDLLVLEDGEITDIVVAKHYSDVSEPEIIKSKELEEKMIETIKDLHIWKTQKNLEKKIHIELDLLMIIEFAKSHS
ncbi:MAG: hypothetical protein LBM67_04885 [Lentimicrobiaceae bacterium]|jgi:hypothetical protein|nr:hypothetical protein [Lentimicrobiaceae bacterium]